MLSMARIRLNAAKHARWFLLVAVMACDPQFRFHGRVMASSGEPIDGAKARVSCPGDFASAVTAADGRFLQLGVGWCSMTCTVEIDAPGFRHASFKVSDNCKGRRFLPRGTCDDVEVDAKLVR